MSEVKIQDVARLAGVSPSSISNYLNNRMGQMRPDTQTRIRQAIEQLDYRPNNAARQLKTGVAAMIGLLVPSLANQYFGALACAVEVAASKRQCNVMTFSTFRDPAREREVVSELLARGVHGIIAGSALNDTEHLVAIASRAPVVAFDITRSEVDHTSINTVSVDNAMATSLAVNHLVTLGHTSIVLVTPPLLTLNRRERVAGFRAAIARLNVTGDVVIMESTGEPFDRHGDTQLFELGRRAAASILEASVKPTAAIAINDMLALGISTGMKQLGIKIPESFSLIGIDDIFMSSISDPPLTTLRQPIQDMANAAVNRILDATADPGGEIFPTELVVRGSTAPPAR